jgi:uncharacterized protein YjbI with pentapeptide repeats
VVKKSVEHLLLAPNLPPNLPLSQMNQFHDEDNVELSLIQDCTIEVQSAENLKINQVVFKNVVFKNVHWPGVKLTDTVFEQCDLSNIDFSQCNMDRVKLINCKLVGINMAESSLRNIVIDNCNATYAVLRYLKCKRGSFRNTSFVEADIYSATLTDLSFTCCNLDRVQFSGTNLAGIDLSTCQFYQLALTPDDLRGCIIDAAQAIALANIFGVVIKE